MAPAGGSHEHQHDRAPVREHQPRSRAGRGGRGRAGRPDPGRHHPAGRSVASAGGLPGGVALPSDLHRPLLRRADLGDPPPSQRHQLQGEPAAWPARRRPACRRSVRRPELGEGGHRASTIHRSRLHRRGARFRARLRPSQLPQSRRHDAAAGLVGPGRRLRSGASQPVRLRTSVHAGGDQRRLACRRSVSSPGLRPATKRHRQGHSRCSYAGHRRGQRTGRRLTPGCGLRGRVAVRPPVDAAPRHVREPGRLGASPGGTGLGR